MTKTKILVVEDDTDVLGLLQPYLEASGHGLVSARDGIDVFRKCRESIGGVLTDLELPRLGGWETFQEMKKIDPTVRALFAGGTVNRKLREDALKIGAVDFLPKPFTPAEMPEQATSLLSQR